MQGIRDQSSILDYAAPPKIHAVKLNPVLVLLLASALLLSMISLLPPEVIVRIGADVIVVKLWMLWLMSASGCVLAKRVHWGWLFLAIWAFICVSCFWMGVTHYMNDVNSFVPNGIVNR